MRFTIKSQNIVTSIINAYIWIYCATVRCASLFAKLMFTNSYFYTHEMQNTVYIFLCSDGEERCRRAPQSDIMLRNIYESRSAKWHQYSSSGLPERVGVLSEWMDWFITQKNKIIIKRTVIVNVFEMLTFGSSYQIKDTVWHITVFFLVYFTTFNILISFNHHFFIRNIIIFKFG